jgi:type I restriction enzyme M protein
LEKQEIEMLKQLNLDSFSSNILNKLRAKAPAEEYFRFLIFLAASAYWYKKSGTTEGLLAAMADTITDEVTLKFLSNFVQRYRTETKEIAETLDVNILKAIVLFSNPVDVFRANGEFSTPMGICQLAIKLLDIKAIDVVLNLGSGINTFLIEAAINSSAKQFLGVDINTNMIILANIRSAIADMPIINIQGNILSQDFSHLKATKVFADFPFMTNLQSLKKQIESNKKLSAYFINSKRTISSDWFFSTTAMLSQAKQGKTVVIMANRGLWNEADRDIRKTFITSGLIEAVISLPERLLSYTNIPVTMLVFSQGNDSVKMIDASDLYTAGRRQNTLTEKNIHDILLAYEVESDKSRRVTIKELEAQEYILNPQRYVKLPEERLDNAVLLGDICRSINRGAVLKSTDLDQLVSPQPTEFQYLMLKDVRDGQISGELPYLNSIDEKYDKFCIKNGNLIISKISPFKVAIVNIRSDEKVLANGNLYFLEIDESKTNPLYVMLYLQSESGMTQLNSWAKGVVMKSISIKDLQRIQIPNISLKKQNRIAKEYQELSNELLIISKQEDMIRDKISNLMQEVL